VKPERDQNNRASRRENWWLFGETNPKLRKQLANLARYIATVETAKHRLFQFLDASILPDNKLVAIAWSEAFHHGVLSSQVHGLWSLAAGSFLGVGNDPVYVKSTCFDTFPFPDDTGLPPELRQKISTLAEQIDTHRKRVLDLLPASATPKAPDEASGRALSGADFCAFDSVRPPAMPATALAHANPLDSQTHTTNTTTAPAVKNNKDLTLTLLQTLEALGRAQQAQVHDATVWRA